MLTAAPDPAERVTTAHRAKLAYIYVRQSTAGQVRQHQESTALQYRLVDRAAGLGWPRERIAVIDDDLGKSGTSSAERHGFQRLIAEVGMGKAGLVLSLDASRLARNNRDWHQLLELCSIFGVIIGGGERLYDPGVYHDRLLLGLSGIMSEAELHQIRMRLHQGERQKAARGELRLPLPAGLAYGRGGEITLNPDEEVQARLRLVFGLFQALQTAKAVMRELRRHGLLLPARPLHGPAPHAIVWVPADSARVLQILQNPSYAGAYVYGRHRQDPLRRRTRAARSATARVPVEQWPICLRALTRSTQKPVSALWNVTRSTRPASTSVGAPWTAVVGEGAGMWVRGASRQGQTLPSVRRSVRFGELSGAHPSASWLQPLPPSRPAKHGPESQSQLHRRHATEPIDHPRASSGHSGRRPNQQLGAYWH